MDALNTNTIDLVKDYHSELIEKLFYSFLDT